MKTLQDIIDSAKKIETKRVAVVGADDFEAVKAVAEAFDEGFVKPVLIGHKDEITKNLEKLGKNFEIIDAANIYESSEKGVRLVSSGAADVLMKGNVKTSVLLKAALNKEWGLRTGSVISHVAVMETPNLEKIVMVTDGGMLVKPDLNQKISIINNAVELARSLYIETPKVAVLAAVEVVNPDMPETLDASILTQMNRRGQIKNCIVDGPLALDNALSEMAAKIKHIESDVAGFADILVVPDIHSGNILGKSAIYLAGGRIAGIILGTAAPIVIVSRADDSKSKMASLALACMNSEKK